VEPPNAAWTSIAFSIGGGGEDLTDRHAKQVKTLQRRGGAARELEPDRFARRRERAVRQRQPQAFRDTCDVAAVPRNWHPPPDDPHARHPMVAA
jgi:hypothetical protein